MSYSLTRVCGRCAGVVAMGGSARVASVMTSGPHRHSMKQSTISRIRLLPALEPMPLG